MNKLEFGATLAGAGLVVSGLAGCEGGHHSSQAPEIEAKSPATVYHIGIPEWLEVAKVQSANIGGGYSDVEKAGSKCAVGFGDTIVEQSPDIFIYRNPLKGYHGTTCFDGTELKLSVAEAKQQEADFKLEAHLKRQTINYVIRALRHKSGSEHDQRPAKQQWVIVANPKAIHSGNDSFSFGDACIISPKHDGQIAKVATLPDSQPLEKYSTKRKAFGSDCPSDILFLGKGALHIPDVYN